MHREGVISAPSPSCAAQCCFKLYPTLIHVTLARVLIRSNPGAWLVQSLVSESGGDSRTIIHWFHLFSLNIYIYITQKLKKKTPTGARMPEQISVSEFVSETLEDINSPITSNFTSKMTNCRNTVTALEEVRNAKVPGGGVVRGSNAGLLYNRILFM